MLRFFLINFLFQSFEEKLEFLGKVNENELIDDSILFQGYLVKLAANC